MAQGRERTLVLRTELNLNIQYRAAWHTEQPTGRVLAPVDAAPEPGQILSFIRHCILVVTLNQMLMATAKISELVILRLIARHSFYRFDPAVPSVTEITRDIVLCILGCEIIFYYSHRLLHIRTFYQSIHNQHHQFKAPIAFAAQYAHPLEYLLSTILPFWLPPQILGCHIITCLLFWTVATVETVIAHSGYDFFTVLSKKHDLHHEKSRVNFGTLGFLDWLHGTGA
ncbi:sterol desaturase [Aureobasidium pullulans]|nr:sterol desaturase [Aureobasidium pullulans]